MREFSRSYGHWAWVALLLLGPFFLFPQASRGLILLVVPALWLLRKVMLGSFFPRTPYNLGIYLLLVTIGLSLWVTYDWAVSLPKISVLLFSIGLFFAIVDFSHLASIWIPVTVYMVVGVAMAMAGLLGATWQPPFDFLNRFAALVPALAESGVPGTSAGFINANEVAGVLSWIVPVMFACVLGLKRRLWYRNKPAYIALIMATTATAFLLIATSSRGGMLALLVSTVLVLAFFVSGRWRLVLAIGVIITILVLVSIINNIPGEDIVGDALGLSGRIEIWSRALLALQDNLLLGVSVNGFRHVVHVLYPLFTIAEDIDLAHAHNHLLQVALDLGLGGLISYLALWLVSAGLLWATYRNLVRRGARHHPYYTLVAGLTGSLLAGWTFGVFDAVALGSRPSFMWWLLISFTAGVHYLVIYSGKRLYSHRRSSSLQEPVYDPHATSAENAPLRRPASSNTVLAQDGSPTYNAGN